MKRIIFLIVALPVLVASCYKDKGNYDYADVKNPQVTIAEVEVTNNATLVYDRFETATLTPDVKIDGAAANPADLEYEWRMLPAEPIYYEGEGWEQIKVIGSGPTLSYHLDDYPRMYIVSLQVRNKFTDAKTTYRFNIDISTTTGWAVIDEDADSNGDLSVIRDAQFVPGLRENLVGITRNVYAQNNDGAKFINAKFANYRNMDNSQYNNIYVYTDDGMYKLDPRVFELVTDDYPAMFVSPPSAFEPMADYYESPLYGKVQFFLVNSNLYTIDWMMMGQKDTYGTAYGYYGVPMAFEPFIAGIPSTITDRSYLAVLYYDKSEYMNGAFALMHIWGYDTPPYVELGSAPFDPSAVGASMDLFYLGAGREGITCAIFKDNTDNNTPYLLVGDFRRDPALPLLKKSLLSLPSIDGLDKVVFGTRGDVMFYSTPDGVYRYSYFDDGATAEQVLPTGDGEVVTCMKIYTHSDNPDYSGRLLMVATWNGSAGKVYKIPFNELSGVPGTVETFTGFGKVVDMFNLE